MESRFVVAACLWQFRPLDSPFGLATRLLTAFASRVLTCSTVPLLSCSTIPSPVAKKWSGRPDLNRGPPRPERGALSRLSHAPTTPYRNPARPFCQV